MAGVVLARAEGKLFAVAVLIIFFSLQLSGYAYIPFEVYRILAGSFIKLAWSTFFLYFSVLLSISYSSGAGLLACSVPTSYSG